ncbi:MAG: FmdE family protein, partial [Candidatus Hydrothermarchaeales archaeon]
MLEEHEIKGAVDFHGHLCFGLSVGLAASKFAMEYLSVGKAKGEELVVIVENNSCAVDAIQFVAGTTLGRGNLIVK